METINTYEIFNNGNMFYIEETETGYYVSVNGNIEFISDYVSLNEYIQYYGCYEY